MPPGTACARRRSPLSSPGGALLLLAAALVGVIAWQFAAAPETEPPHSAAVPPAALQFAPSLPASRAALPGTARDRAETALGRPLFRPDRRPAPPAAGTAPRPTEDLPRLTALLAGPFGRRAIFAETDGRSTVVEEGATMGEWIILSIGAGAVTVAGGEGRRLLRLAHGAGAAAPALPPQPPDEHGAGVLLRLPAAGPMIPPAAPPRPGRP